MLKSRLNITILACCLLFTNDTFGAPTQPSPTTCMNWLDEQEMLLYMAEKNFTIGKRSIWDESDYAAEKLKDSYDTAFFHKEDFTYIWGLCKDHLPDFTKKDAQLKDQKYVKLEDSTFCAMEILGFSEDYKELLKTIDDYNEIVNMFSESDKSMVSMSGDLVLSVSDRVNEKFYSIDRFCREEATDVTEIEDKFWNTYNSSLQDIDTFFSEKFRVREN